MKDFIDLILKKEKKPISVEKIYDKVKFLLNNSRDEDFELTEETKKEILDILNKGVQDCDYVKTLNGNYCSITKTSFRKGRFVGNRKGEGFVIVHTTYVNRDGEKITQEDKFNISKDYINGAIDGDIVLVDVGSKHVPCKVEKIIERNLENITGEVYCIGSKYYVKPIDKRKQGLTIMLNGVAIEGQRVSVKLLSQQSNNFYIGEVTRVFSHKDDPDEDILWEAFKCGIDDQFSDESLKQVLDIPQSVRDIDKLGRNDLTSWEIFTIDGDDTKDIDDALSCKILPNGNYLVGVHIADVSHYVTKGSPLDKDAYKRGTSYYLGGKVIPMLPHELSNGICSLNPNVERLAKSCIMEITPNGDVVRFDIKPTVIRSRLKMTYKKVNQILNDGIIPPEYEEHVDTLNNLCKLASVLRNKRIQAGAMEFDRPELRLIFDEKGSVCDLLAKKSDVAENLIEEFMLIANETVDRYIVDSGYPCLHRIHDTPNPEKLEEFFKLLEAVNLPFNSHSPNECIYCSKYLQELGEHIKQDSRLSNMLSLNLVKCMSRAKYSPNNIGHSGLAKSFYCHYTSPIRRYPDLTIHRILNSIYDNSDAQQQLDDELLDIGLQSSKMEKVADDAEEQVLRMKCSEYMEKHIGEEFIGTIINVSDKTVLVQLDNMIEGRIRTRSLPGAHIYNPETYTLLSVDGRDNYYVGDRLKVRVSGASKEDKTIDFEIVEKISENCIIDRNGSNKSVKTKIKK